MSSMRVQTIKIADVHSNRAQPASRTEARALSGLYAQMKERGQKVPALIMRNASGFEMIDGHRRKAVLESLGAKTIECIVLDEGDPIAELIASNRFTRSYKGVEYLASWAQLDTKEDRAELLKAIPANSKSQICRLIKELGEKRLEQLARRKPFSPSVVHTASLLWLRYQKVCTTIPAPRVAELIEWCLAHRGQTVLQTFHRNGTSVQLRKLAGRIRNAQPFPQSDW